MPFVMLASAAAVCLLFGLYYAFEVVRPRRTAAVAVSTRNSSSPGAAIIGTLSIKRRSSLQVKEWVALIGEGRIDFRRDGSMGSQQLSVLRDDGEEVWWLHDQGEIRVEPRRLIFRADRGDLSDFVGHLRADGWDVHEHRGYLPPPLAR